MKKELELYIHIPFCIRKCSYCDFLSFPAALQTQEEYIETLLLEIRGRSAKYADYEVSTIFFGGGTPSCIPEELFEKIVRELRLCFAVAADAEITIECNPGTLTRRKLAVYRTCGVNRLSIGLQSANDEELKLLGRIHTFARFAESYQMAVDCGFSNINVDLISSLPGQTLTSFTESLKKVLAFAPTHLSVYSLIIEPGTPYYDRYQDDIRRREKGEQTLYLPNEEEEYEIGKVTQQLLAEHGYERYEISNYAKPGAGCRHNCGYWTGVPYLGLGLGASSYIEESRLTNESDLTCYRDKVRSGEEPIAESVEVDEQARMEEFMFLGLRMTEGVSLARFQELFHRSLEEAYPQVIRKLCAESLLLVENGRARLTDQGMDLANYCMAMFLS